MAQGENGEILYCNLREPDEYGHVLYEIKGLDEEAVEVIREVVLSHGSCGIAFQGGNKVLEKSAMINYAGTTTAASTQSINIAGSKYTINDEGFRHRKLGKVLGNSTVLAVRIFALDVRALVSENDLRVNLFGGTDDSGMVQRVHIKGESAACSFGKWNLVQPESDPTYPDITDGVVTISLNKTVSGISHGTVLSWALTEIPNFAGPLNNYEHILIFMPAEVEFPYATGLAQLGGRLSVRSVYIAIAGSRPISDIITSFFNGLFSVVPHQLVQGTSVSVAFDYKHEGLHTIVNNMHVSVTLLLNYSTGQDGIS